MGVDYIADLNFLFIQCFQDLFAFPTLLYLTEKNINFLPMSKRAKSFDKISICSLERKGRKQNVKANLNTCPSHGSLTQRRSHKGAGT